MVSEEKLHQYRWVADQIIAACRLQHRRITSGDSVGRHDVDFYTLSVDRLRELMRMMRDKLQLEAAKPLLADFEGDFPTVEGIRDWLMHPADINRIGNASTFSDSVWRRRADGGWDRLVEPESDQPVVEAYYERVCTILGELPPRVARS